MNENIISIEYHKKRPDFLYIAVKECSDGKEKAGSMWESEVWESEVLACFSVPDEPQRLTSNIINEAYDFIRAYNAGKKPSLDEHKKRVNSQLEKER